MKKAKFWAMLLMVTFTMGAVCACGDDDDDDGGGGGNVPSSQITGTDGTAIRLTSLGYQSGNGKIENDYYTFQYDSNGKLSGFGSSEFTYTMNDGNFSASWGGEDEIVTGSIKFETNNKGHVTRITIDTYSKVYDGSWSKDKGTTNFKYDSDGQLIEASGTGTTEGYNEDYGGNYNESASGKVSYVWVGGNLIKATNEDNSTISAAGTSYSYKETNTANLTYSSEQNPLRQNPYWEMKGNDALEIIGLFGVGPVNLPSKCEEANISYEDGELDFETAYETTYTFSLNDNGTINTQTNSERTIKSSFSNVAGGHSSTYYFGYNGNMTRSTDLESKQVKHIAHAICAKLFKTHRKNKK